MNTKPFIELPTAIGKEFINPEDIISIRACDKTIIIAIENKQEKEVRLSLGKAERLFDHPWFVKCHRSHIINILKIKEFICKQNIIRLVNDTLIPLSGTYKEQFEQAIENHCKKWGGVNY